MKAHSIFLFLLPTLLLSSCKKDKRKLLFDMPLSSLEFTVEAGLNTVDTYYFFFDDVPTHFAELADTYHTDSTLVDAILPGNAFIRSIFGESYEDIFWEIAVHICPVGEQSFKCGHEVFYWNFPTHELSSDFDLVPNEPDLKEWLTRERVNVQLWFRLAKVPSQSIASRLDLRFNVFAKE